MKFLVIGGAGYIGSHFIRYALDRGHDCQVLDNLSRGFRWAVPDGVQLFEADVRDKAAVSQVLKSYDPDAVLHYAAYALVPESVADPELYRDNNENGCRSLLDALAEHKRDVPLVFSSSCAVYGTPNKLPITESMPYNPESPYGETKVNCEKMIQQYCALSGRRAMALRYFNACGADPKGAIGEAHDPETHLIPNVLLSLLRGSEVKIFGSDFPTRDGSCVRDYIHVHDLAESHLIAAEKMTTGECSGFQAINLGTGQGYSNLEILKAAEKVAEIKASYSMAPRRSGDPAELYADNNLAREVLGFTPSHSDLQFILETAWKWHKSKTK